MEPETLRRVIALTESVGAVVLQCGYYRIDQRVEQSFVPESYRPLIAAAVARANCDPAAKREREADTIHAAGLEDLGKAIGDVVKILPGIADLAEDLKTLFGGTTLRASWWGVEAVLSGVAAVAFFKLLEHDLNAVLSACDGRRENVARDGGRRSVRKRSAHGLAHGLGATMELSLTPSRFPGCEVYGCTPTWRSGPRSAVAFSLTA